MPNCFCLWRKTDEKKTLVKFVEIDDELRKVFEQPADEVNYLWGWYDIIGMYLACGWSFDRIIDEGVKSEELQKVARYLRENYASDAWAEIGKRR